METLSVNLESLDDKAMLAATAGDNPRIVIDFYPPVGTGKGYTSMELLMAAYGSCVSTVLVSILRHRMKKTVHGVGIQVGGTPRESHPKSLESMTAVLRLKAEGVTREEAQHALEDAEKICPVGAMLKGNVAIDVSVELV